MNNNFFLQLTIIIYIINIIKIYKYIYRNLESDSITKLPNEIFSLTNLKFL